MRTRATSSLFPLVAGRAKVAAAKPDCLGDQVLQFAHHLFLRLLRTFLTAFSGS
jgi:hypothetical protein